MAALLIQACASVAPPEGGNRDTTPPKLVRTEPNNGATRVSGRRVRLFFDEDVTTGQLTQQLIVTPEVGKVGPIVKEEGQSFTLQFNEPFAPNTTYSLDFGETITDVTERNKAEHITLTFTTGEVLDSGSVKGTVTQLLSGKPEAEVTVGLYPFSDTVNPGRQRPFYRTITDKSGNYAFGSVKPGTYRIFALDDANKNQLYEEPERLAYRPDSTVVSRKTAPVNLQTERLDTRKPYISNREESPGKVTLRYNEGLGAAKARTINRNQGFSYRLNEANPKELELFSNRSDASEKLIIGAVDSTGNQKIDTITVKFDGVEKGKARAVSADIRLRADAQEQGTVELVFPIAVTLKPGTTSIGQIERVKSDKSVEVVRQLPGDKVVRLDSSQTKVTLSVGALKAPAGERLQLWLDSTAWLTTSGQPIRFPRTSLILPENGGVGSVSGVMTTASSHYQVQLLNEAGKIAQQVANAKSFVFPDLAPGKYRLRVLIDANANGRWDGPDPRFRRLPEPVFFHPDVIDVRANWEQAVKLSF